MTGLARAPLTLGLATLALLVAGFGTWSVGTRLHGAIIAHGVVEVERNRQVVQHPDGGVVEAVLVAEGAVVTTGQPLIRLDGGPLRSDLSIIESQIYELQARRGRLMAERDDAPAPAFPPELVAAARTSPDAATLMDGQRRLFDARRDTLSRHLEQLARRADQTRAQIDGHDAQATAIARQLALIRTEAATTRDLVDKGLAPAARRMALDREEARLMGEAGDLAAARAMAEGRITELAIEGLRLAAARREEANAQLRDIGYRELELAERHRALTQRLARLDLTAPTAGIVMGLAVTTPRAVLRPAEPALYLVPQDRPLVIAAKVPPLHIDQVHPGQPVTLVFSAFPARTTPELSGTVLHVSPDALTDPHTGAAHYRVEIAPDPGQTDRLGTLSLLPGMPVEAFLRTDSRTPLAWLVQPFTDYFTRALRES